MLIFCFVIPLVGTLLGAAAVFFYRGKGTDAARRMIHALAAGVMLASAFFSLLVPALDGDAPLGIWGLSLGLLFFLVPEYLPGSEHRPQEKTTTLFAITLHNLPEGMAVGVAAAAFFMGAEGMTAAGLIALSTGIAIQNLPEGAIVSLPLAQAGKGRWRAFAMGTLSGAIEPVGAILAFVFSELTAAFLPFFLAFASGAMLSAVTGELFEDIIGKEKGVAVRLVFVFGLVLMTALDSLLG